MFESCVSEVLDSFLRYRSEKENDSRGVTLHLAFIISETGNYQGHGSENLNSHKIFFNDLEILVSAKH